MTVETTEIPTSPAADPPPKGGDKTKLLTLDHLDGRTTAARRARGLVAAIESDLGGTEGLSEGTRQLVQRAAVIATIIEHQETQWLGGGEIDLANYLQAISVQRRVLLSLGLNRRAKDVTPNPLTYKGGGDGDAA